jgi:hypothetical protein
MRVLHEGPLARRHFGLGVMLGIVLPLLTLPLTAHPITWALIALITLVGLWSEEDLLVRAGQAIPIH